AGPPVAEDVLVEVLSGADAEEEPPRHHARGGCGGLRHERGMDPGRGTGHRGPEAEALRRSCDAADHAPDERALSLSVRPRMEVVGDRAELEAGLLGTLRVADEIRRGVFLRGELVAVTGHVGSSFGMETSLQPQGDVPRLLLRRTGIATR